MALAPPAVLADVGTAVSVAGPVGPRRFLVAGRLAAAGGTERGGVEAVRIGTRLVAGAVGAGVGGSANVLTSPGLLRREMVGPGGAVLETVLAVPTLPAVAIQWTVPPGLSEPPVREVVVHLLPGVAEVRYGAGEALVRAADASRPDELVAMCVHPTPRRWEVHPGEGGGLSVTAVVAGGPATLVLAAGPGSTVDTTVSAAWSLDAHAARVVRDTDPKRSTTLAPATGASALDHAWAWARARVRTALEWCAPGSIARPEDVFWTGIGALSIGDAATASTALALLEEGGAPEGETGSGAALPASALATLLAARIALTLGDVAPARRHLRRLAGESSDAARRPTDRHAKAWWTLALDALADALHHTADPDVLEDLRHGGATPPGLAGTGNTAVRLPMVDSPAVGPPAASLLRALLPGPGGAVGWARGDTPVPGGGPGPGGNDIEAALTPWHACASGRADEGYAAWRRTLGDGLEGAVSAGGGCRGTWDPVDDLRRAGAPGAGILLATLVHGVLGVVPDAPAGRLRLAPALPSHVRTFRVRNIPVGDARVGLEYRREGPGHRFVLTPAEGRVPPMVVFEPAVAGSVRAVRVDGSAAELDSVEAGGRTRVRAQLPLDGVRTLDIEC